jgi:hypothetical protein
MELNESRRKDNPRPNWSFNADANTGHAFGILLASVGALRPYGLRRRLTLALGLMKLGKQVAMFLLALVAVDYLCTQIVNAARTQYLAHLDHGAWWPANFAALEFLELSIYGFVFAVVGVIISAAIKQKIQAVLVASALAITYSTVAFFIEPDLPFARYSHAPIWLWVVSWSQFYTPVLACTITAYFFGSCLHVKRETA